MRFVARVKKEWEDQKLPHVPFKTPEEVQRITNGNYVWAGRIQQKMGRPLTDQEIRELMF